MTVAIIPTTGASEFKFKVKANNPVTLITNGLQGSETMPLTIRTGSDDVAVGDDNDDPVALSATKKQIIIRGSGSYKLTKPVTVAAVGLFIER